MAVFGVYTQSDMQLEFVTSRKSDLEDFNFTPFIIERYEKLTPTQVKQLPYSVAKTCENLMRSY